MRPTRQEEPGPDSKYLCQDWYEIRARSHADFILPNSCRSDADGVADFSFRHASEVTGLSQACRVKDPGHFAGRARRRRCANQGELLGLIPFHRWSAAGAVQARVHEVLAEAWRRVLPQAVHR